MRLLIPLMLLLSVSACVDRKLTVKTVPDNADVFVDGTHVGSSPVTLPFTYYGTVEIVVRKPGYRTERHLETRQPPEFQQFPYDLYYETMTRDLYVDHRTYFYSLAPTSPEERNREAVEAAIRRYEELKVR